MRANLIQHLTTFDENSNHTEWTPWHASFIEHLNKIDYIQIWAKYEYIWYYCSKSCRIKHITGCAPHAKTTLLVVLRVLLFWLGLTTRANTPLIVFPFYKLARFLSFTDVPIIADRIAFHFCLQNVCRHLIDFNLLSPTQARFHHAVSLFWPWERSPGSHLYLPSPLWTHV